MQSLKVFSLWSLAQVTEMRIIFYFFGAGIERKFNGDGVGVGEGVVVKTLSLETGRIYAILHASRVQDRSCFSDAANDGRTARSIPIGRCVESYRTAKGSRQRVVAYLGELTAGEESGWAKLGRHLDGNQAARRPQLSLFDPPRHEEPGDDEPVLVRLSGVRVERLRDFGDVWLAWGLWRTLDQHATPVETSSQQSSQHFRGPNRQTGSGRGTSRHNAKKSRSVIYRRNRYL